MGCGIADANWSPNPQIDPQTSSNFEIKNLVPRRTIIEPNLPNPERHLRSLMKDAYSVRPISRALGITSEWWPASVRNGGRFQIGIPAGIMFGIPAVIMSEYLAGMRRNLHDRCELGICRAGHSEVAVSTFDTALRAIANGAEESREAGKTRSHSR